jgi:two-component system, sensor histidine kinase
MSNRILVVEDNKIVRDAMLSYINSFDVNCYAVTTGEEAVDLAEYFDLIFMNVDLPGISGVEAARRIRQREKDKRLDPVAMVATTRGYIEHECFAAGMNDLLRKPLTRNAVGTLIERWVLSRPRKLRLLN